MNVGTSGRALAGRVLLLGMLAAIGAVALLYLLGAFEMRVGGGLPESWAARRARQQAWAAVGPDEETGFTRFDLTNPDGWLATVSEDAQTLARYQGHAPVRPTAERRTIVLQPLGPMGTRQRAMVGLMREYAEAFFQLPARVTKAVPLEAPRGGRALTRTFGTGRSQLVQYDASMVLEGILRPRLPADALACFGVTNQDLWVPGLNFVFGLGDYHDRVGVYSLCRYDPAFWGHPRGAGSDRLQLLRACKVLNHELGHVLGLSHCVFYKCSMNGSNSLWGIDAAPIDYCPLCLRKLLWNVGCDPTRRFKALVTFYRRHGLETEAAWTQRRLAHRPAQR